MHFRWICTCQVVWMTCIQGKKKVRILSGIYFDNDYHFLYIFFFECGCAYKIHIVSECLCLLCVNTIHTCHTTRKTGYRWNWRRETTVDLALFREKEDTDLAGDLSGFLSRDGTCCKWTIYIMDEKNTMSQVPIQG